MNDQLGRDNQHRHVQQALEMIENPGDRHFWDVFDELHLLPPSYAVTVEYFREGLSSPHHYIQVVSAHNVGRFARDADWVLPELDGLLKREPHDVLLVSVTAQAIQSLGTREAAAVLASAVERVLHAEISLDRKGELVTYILRSLVSMGLVAHEQRGVFRRAIEYFSAQEKMSWSPECIWELDMFSAQTGEDLHELLRQHPTELLGTEVLFGYRVRAMADTHERVCGDWAVLMDEYCTFSSRGLPNRFAFVQHACYADDPEGRNLGMARVVVLRSKHDITAVCLACDEAGVGPVTWYPEVATAMLHRTIQLDPWAYTLIYHLNAPGCAVRGKLMLVESPSLHVGSPEDLFGADLCDVQALLFEGCALPDETLIAAQHLRKAR